MEGVWLCSSFGQRLRAVPILDAETFTAQTLTDGVLR